MFAVLALLVAAASPDGAEAGYEERLVAWALEQNPGRVVEPNPAGLKVEEVLIAAEEVFSAFAEQILAFDTAAAKQYGPIVSHREGAGAPIEGFDAQIASICRAHGAALATRNVKDFRDTGIAVVNPWRDRS